MAKVPGIGGKGSRQQSLLPGQKTTVTPGDTMSRMLGQYGKGHNLMAPGTGTSPVGPADPGADVSSASAMPDHVGSKTIRGGSGGIRLGRTRPGGGSLGQNKMGMPVPDNTPDTSQDLS